MIILALIIFSIFANFVLGTVKIHVETRYCPQNQFGGTDEQFAVRLRDYVIASPQPLGFCSFENPSYPLRSRYICGHGKKRTMGYIWTFTFEDEEDANYQIDFGTDFGWGAAIFVDGVYENAYQRDLWWDHDWETVGGVFFLNYNFAAGNHTVLVIGQEDCCDAGMSVQFSRNDLPREPLTEENLGCQASNQCPADCTENQYQAGRNCFDCSYKCAKCEKKATTCTECSSATRESISECNCKQKYYDIPNQANCGACHSSCKTCSNSSSCDTCESGQYLEGICKSCQSKFTNICGTCSKEECLTCSNNLNFTLPRCNNSSCLQKEYRVGQICKQCHSSCKACVQSNQCTQCESNKYLNNGLCVSCEQTYGNKCGTCDQFKCLTCKVNPAFKLPLCESEVCNLGQTTDGNLCRDCEANCDECLVDTTTCTKCAAGSYLNNANCPLCQSPCKTCVNNATNCTSCVKNNYEISTGCINCINRYFKTNTEECASCEEYYGQICGQCNKTECTECKNNPSFALPTCTSTTCPQKFYKDGNICRTCKSECTSCSNGTTCDQCKDQTYLGADKQCHACTGPCFLCSSQNVCTICKVIGRAPPDCSRCEGRYLMHENECLIACPSGFYADYLRNECRQCSSQCVECTQKSDICTKCPTGKVLHEAKCVTCDEIKGFYQNPGAPEGTCLEKCGDGLRVSNQFACDDGNNIDGDGCSSKCEIEEGWICSGGSTQSTDNCFDKRPIRFSVDFYVEKQYLNIEQNVPIKAVIKFSKQFQLPIGTTLKNFIVIKIAGKDTSGFQITVKERIKNRVLQESSQGFEYEIILKSDLTLRNRELEIDLYPKSAFDDGNGNILVENEKPQKTNVQEYYYYNQNERRYTKIIELMIYIGVLAMMIFIPFYVFYYKNHFNKFYALFFVIDIMQLLYFYRFINIRWPINGIMLFKTLKPSISFFMMNLYKKDIPSDKFSQYSSGLEFFFHLRFGYFQWGILFDFMLATSGVFIIYIFLQITNANDGLNFFLAIGMAVFYFGFFLATLIYIKKNQSILYNKEMDEVVEDMPLLEKIQKNPTFKLRNIWHFIHKLEDGPQKAYFYFVYIFRKIYLAIILITLQSYPTVQISMIALSHIVIIFGLCKYTIFKENREKIRLVLSECFVLGGVGCMYFMLNDSSEDEHFRLKYSWFVMGSLLAGLFIHGAFFCYQEFILPLVQFCLNRKKQRKVIDLRQYRQEGKQEATEFSENSSQRFQSTHSSKFSYQKQNILKQKLKNLEKTQISQYDLASTSSQQNKNSSASNFYSISDTIHSNDSYYQVQKSDDKSVQSNRRKRQKQIQQNLQQSNLSQFSQSKPQNEIQNI